jgi:hypothetical protein
VSINGQAFEVNAAEGRLRIDHLSLLGRVCEAAVAKVKLVGESLQSFVGSVTGKFTQSTRYVKGHDEVQAGSTRHLVENSFTVRAGTAVLRSEKAMKIDGEQIHLG